MSPIRHPQIFEKSNANPPPRDVEILDPKTQVVTGLTRNGVWLIERGRIVRPVTNLRFTQSFIEAFAPGTVRAVGAERALLFGGWDSVYLVPTLHLASWNFTGGARG